MVRNRSISVSFSVYVKEEKNSCKLVWLEICESDLLTLCKVELCADTDICTRTASEHFLNIFIVGMKRSDPCDPCLLSTFYLQILASTWPRIIISICLDWVRLFSMLFNCVLLPWALIVLLYVSRPRSASLYSVSLWILNTQVSDISTIEVTCFCSVYDAVLFLIMVRTGSVSVSA